jgi:peptidyl-prolyl cis-trans isomerase B (cyclophilin B)
MKKNTIIYIVLGLVVCLLLWNFLKVEPINNDININANIVNNNNDVNNNLEEIKGDDKMSEVVVIETSMGNFEIELNREKAPITVENFITYVNEGFYDGVIFHRVIKNFMVQGGGFTPDGNQKDTHAEIKLESQNGLKNNKGTVAMARTNVPDSASSQFFINVVNNDFLNYAPGNDGYAVFGEVITGMDTVEKIKAVKTTTKTGMADWPVDDVVITKAYMKE